MLDAVNLEAIHFITVDAFDRHQLFRVNPGLTDDCAADRAEELFRINLRCRGTAFHQVHMPIVARALSL